MNTTSRTKRGMPSPSNSSAATENVKTSPQAEKTTVKGKQSGSKETKTAGRVWKRPEFPDEIVNPLPHINKAANDELLKVLATPSKEPRKNLQIGVEFDLRNNSRSRYWARIKTDEGVSVAEVWGTKSGKSRSYLVWPKGQLDQESESQLKKALPVARRFVTGKPEMSLADDSAPESGSDTSSDET